MIRALLNTPRSATSIGHRPNVKGAILVPGIRAAMRLRQLQGMQMAECIAVAGRAALRALAGTLTIAIAVLLWLYRPEDNAEFRAIFGVLVVATICAALGAFAFQRASTPAVIAEWIAIGILGALSIVLIVSIGVVFLFAACMILLDVLTMDDEERSAMTAVQHFLVASSAFGATLALLALVIAFLS
jgi:hypothetical protein